MKTRLFQITLTAALLALASNAFAADAPPPAHYGAAARDVMDYLQKTFYDPATGLYLRSETERTPDYMWSNGVVFTALVAATRHEPHTYRPIMDKFFTSMDGYWDAKTSTPGYAAALLADGAADDKYYDDNEWMVITFLEAYQLTTDPRYLDRATQTLAFVRGGWDNQLGGGIWWHLRHKDGTKNACSNAPAAVGCLRLAALGPHDKAPDLVAMAHRIVTWTTAHFQAPDGLFRDRQVVATGDIKRGPPTYNAGLMLRANLGLYRRDGQSEYLQQAQRIAEAADKLADPQSGVYRDGIKYSQFMIEADLELYRTTKEHFLIERAQKNADECYRRWKQQPPPDLISNASIARVLWLMADTETDAGRAFWKTADAAK